MTQRSSANVQRGDAESAKSDIFAGKPPDNDPYGTADPNVDPSGIMDRRRLEIARGNELAEVHMSPDRALRHQAKETREALREMDKFRINIPQPVGTNPAKTKSQDVRVNGVLYKIPYNTWVDAPEEICVQLVGSGIIPPMTEEYEHLAPRVADKLRGQIAGSVPLTDWTGFTPTGEHTDEEYALAYQGGIYDPGNDKALAHG